MIVRIVGASVDLPRIKEYFLDSTDAAVRGLAAGGIKWVAHDCAEQLTADDVLSALEAPNVLVITGWDLRVLRRIGALRAECAIEQRERPHGIQVFAPVVLCCEFAPIAAACYDLPAWINEVAWAGASPQELVQRILLALRRSRHMQAQLRSGMLTLLDERRAVCYEGEMELLSPSEYVLIELLVRKLGSIVTLHELGAALCAAGKSTELNNLRVIIYKARMKIENLTCGQLQLMTVYRKGYSLRQVPVRVAAALRAASEVGSEVAA